MNENLIKVFCHICGKEYFRYLPYILQNRIIECPNCGYILKIENNISLKELNNGTM